MKEELDILNHSDVERHVRGIAWKQIDRLIERDYTTYVFSQSEKSEILDLLIQEMFGFGILEPLLKDASITEIMINGCEQIFIEKDGIISRAADSNGYPIAFASEKELRLVIDRIVAPINRKVDESDPIVDARLPDGSRVNVVLNPIALNGTTITIRKFPENPFDMKQLIDFGSLDDKTAELLEKMVRARYNIIVSGGTGSGKTTFLNALSMYIPRNNRVITVEDSAELKFNQVENLVRMETRPPNMEGKGEISIRKLVKAALRMRPDRIVIGEVRGGEAIDMLQAMNTGHDGSLSTGHANSASDMLMRLETMVLMAGMDLPVKAIRQQIATAVDFIVHLSKLRDGTRRVVEIIEVIGFESDEIVTQSIFRFQENEDMSTENKVGGKLEYCNVPISKTSKFWSAGIRDFQECLVSEVTQ